MPIVFFKDWFFGKLPSYFKDQDTYVDSNGEGLVERYLRNFGMEMDENFYPFIYNFLDLFDALKCQAELLPYLSFLIGSPISIDNTEETYRRVIRYAVQVYKVKGTLLSYQMLFNFMALDVTILEDTPGLPVTYDAEPLFIYDDPDGIKQYDTDCAACSGYSVLYNEFNHDPLFEPITISADQKTIAQKIICFLQPINATFNGYTRRLILFDEFPIDITDESEFTGADTSGEFSDDFDIDNEFD